MVRLTKDEKLLISKMLEGHKIEQWYLDQNLERIKEKMDYMDYYNLLIKARRVKLKREFIKSLIKQNPILIYDTLVEIGFYKKYIKNRKKEPAFLFEHATEINELYNLNKNIRINELIFLLKNNNKRWKTIFNELEAKEIKIGGETILNDLINQQEVFIFHYPTLKHKDERIFDFFNNIAKYIYLSRKKDVTFYDYYDSLREIINSKLRLKEDKIIDIQKSFFNEILSNFRDFYYRFSMKISDLNSHIRKIESDLKLSRYEPDIIENMIKNKLNEIMREKENFFKELSEKDKLLIRKLNKSQREMSEQIKKIRKEINFLEDQLDSLKR